MLVLISAIGVLVSFSILVFFIGHNLGYMEGFNDGMLEAHFADDDYNGEYNEQ